MDQDITSMNKLVLLLAVSVLLAIGASQALPYFPPGTPPVDVLPFNGPNGGNGPFSNNNFNPFGGGVGPVIIPPPNPFGGGVGPVIIPPPNPFGGGVGPVVINPPNPQPIQNPIPPPSPYPVPYPVPNPNPIPAPAPTPTPAVPVNPSLPPQYVKSLQIINNANNTATVIVTFQSGKTNTYYIISAADELISNSAWNGQFMGIDPVTSFGVTVNGITSSFVTNNAVTIELRVYTINADSSVTRTS